jgi:hypothetical protein
MESPLSKSTNSDFYAQQQRVNLLRQQVLDPLDPASTAALLPELLEAEDELERLAKQQPPQSPGGVLLDNRPAAGAGGVLMGADTTGLEVSVKLRQAQVPTSIIHLLEKEAYPLVSYDLKYTGGEFMRLRIASYVEGYSAQVVDTVELTYKTREAAVNQLPTFFPDRLNSLSELARATLHVQVDDLDGQVQLQSTYPIWLLARSSAYLNVRDPATGDFIDLRPYLAAWVTPNAPEIMDMLRQAAELHPKRQIVGYQVDAEGVRTQVQCIFEALKARQITYVNSLVSFSGEAGPRMQRVRLPREALHYRSANCIDGTVLMASLLEFASLSPGIVLVPGHAFLGWQKEKNVDGINDLDPETGSWDYLETTMIGSDCFEEANARGRLLAAQYQKQAAKTGNPDFFYLISLREARTTRHILPME